MKTARPIDTKKLAEENAKLVRKVQDLESQAEENKITIEGLRAEMLEKTSTIQRMPKENQKLLRAGKVWTDNEETALKEFLNSNDKMEDAKK